MPDYSFNPLLEEEITEEQLKNYILAKDAELESDVSYRVNGEVMKNTDGYKYAGYKRLRQFYDGDQWLYPKEGGGNQRVYNFCRQIALTYTYFLSNEPPEFDCPARDINDDLEVALAEEREHILNAILDDNKFPLVFEAAVHNASVLGDAMIFGPYIEKVKVGKKIIPRIRFQNVKRPENVRILWSDESWTEMDGFIFHWRMSVNKAKEIWGEELKKRKINLSQNYPVSQYTTEEETKYPMVTVLQYWDRRYMMTLFNGQVIDFVKHDWGFLPLEYVRNIEHPYRMWGISDLEDILDAQLEFNEIQGDIRDIISQDAKKKILTSNIAAGGLGEYKAGVMQIIDLGEDAVVHPFPPSTSTGMAEAYKEGIKNNIYNLSMISEILFGSKGAMNLSGRGMSVLMQNVNNKVKAKQMRWVVALKSLAKNIFILCEKYFPESRKIIQGNYDVDIFFPTVLIRNLTDEINKFNMKLQSQYTTMKNIGVSSPKDEIKRMKAEWEDLSLGIEISRQPALRFQLNKLSQSKRVAPQLKEEENSGEEQPMSSEGVPVRAPISKEGAIREETQQRGLNR